MASMWLISSLRRASFTSMTRSWWKIANVANSATEILMVKAMVSLSCAM